MALDKISKILNRKKEIEDKLDEIKTNYLLSDDEKINSLTWSEIQSLEAENVFLSRALKISIPFYKKDYKRLRDGKVSSRYFLFYTLFLSVSSIIVFLSGLIDPGYVLMLILASVISIISLVFGRFRKTALIVSSVLTMNIVLILINSFLVWQNYRNPFLNLSADDLRAIKKQVIKEYI